MQNRDRWRGRQGFVAAVALVMGAAIAEAAPSGQVAPKPPATRAAAVAELLANGFSSITSLDQQGGLWTGRGVRHAVFVAFAINGQGALSCHPVAR